MTDHDSGSSELSEHMAALTTQQVHDLCGTLMEAHDLIAVVLCAKPQGEDDREARDSCLHMAKAKMLAIHGELLAAS